MLLQEKQLMKTRLVALKSSQGWKNDEERLKEFHAVLLGQKTSALLKRDRKKEKIIAKEIERAEAVKKGLGDFFDQDYSSLSS